MESRIVREANGAKYLYDFDERFGVCYVLRFRLNDKMMGPAGGQYQDAVARFRIRSMKTFKERWMYMMNLCIKGNWSVRTIEEYLAPLIRSGISKNLILPDNFIEEVRCHEDCIYIKFRLEEAILLEMQFKLGHGDYHRPPIHEYITYAKGVNPIRNNK